MINLDAEQERRLEALYMQMYKRLFFYAFTIFQNPVQAEDAVQDAFQIACRKIDALEASPNPEGWIMNTLKNVMRNAQQKQRTKDTMTVSHRDLDKNIPARPRNISAETEIAFIHVLGETDYRLLKRVALKESTIAEAAEEFGLSPEACSKRIQRSKKKLRKFFEKNGDPVSENEVPDT